MQRREFLAASAVVTRFGAVGDGKKMETAAIQKAMDACSASGGGVLYFPPGRYLTGGLDWRNGVTLHLEAGATLIGSPRIDDYPIRRPELRSYTDNYTERSLLYAEKLSDIGIEGLGTIDGQGASFKGPYKVRPYLIRVIQCRRVTVTGVRIINSPMWVQHYLDCEDVAIRGIRVDSRVNANNDGIDIDASRRVRISDCDITSGDDAIVLKSTTMGITRDVVITNCVLSTACNALKLGTESNGGFDNIAISNISIYNTRLSGLALEAVDGGILDRVSVTNLLMNGVGAPIFIRLGDRARPIKEGDPRPGVGALRNITITNVTADRASVIGCPISGLPGHPIEKLTLENLRLRFVGGGTAADAARRIEELADKYPEHQMFGRLPAFGIWIRHARRVFLRNVELETAAPDARPPLVVDDVEGLRTTDSPAVTRA